MCSYEEGRIDVIKELQNRQQALMWHIRSAIANIISNDGEFYSKSNKELVEFMKEYLANREEIIRLCRDIDLIRAVLTEKGN